MVWPVNNTINCYIVRIVIYSMHSNFVISFIVTSNKIGLSYKHVYTDHFISNVAEFSPQIAVFFRSFNTAIAVIYFRKLNPLLLMRTNHFL